MKAELIQAHFYELEKSFKVDWAFEFDSKSGGYLVSGIIEGDNFSFHSYDINDKNDINIKLGLLFRVEV